MPRIQPIDDFKEILERVDIKTVDIYYPYTCFGCGAAIPYFRPKIKLINIHQNPTIKFFCCKSCRDSWASRLKIKFNPALIDLPTKNVI